MAKNRKPKWYNAYAEIATFAIPLLEKFLDKHSGGVPASLIDQFNGDGDLALRRWEEMINDMLHGLYACVDRVEHDERAQEGLELFGKWFTHLWD